MTRASFNSNYSHSLFDFQLNILLSALCHIWLGEALHDDYLIALDEHFSYWQRSNNAFLANVCAQLLAKYGVGNKTLNAGKKAFYQRYLSTLFN